MSKKIVRGNIGNRSNLEWRIAVWWSRKFDGIASLTIIGSDFDDTITGGTGADKLTGGAGDDVFIIATGGTEITAATSDTIADFKVADDFLQLGVDGTLATYELVDAEDVYSGNMLFASATVTCFATALTVANTVNS